MKYTNAIVISVISGFIILLLMYAASASTVPTGKVSATMVNYSVFSTIVGVIVIVMAILSIKHSSKTPRVV